jgi:rubrerythrin
MKANEVDRYLQHSAKIEIDDLDWDHAARIGLTEDEAFVLTYFSDIESQTIRYLRTLLSMDIALQPDVAAFLTTWNYEEYFHGHALAKLLQVSGRGLSEDRVAAVKSQAKFNEWLERLFAPLLARIFSSQFPAVYMAFGAIQEMTTLRGYERLAKSTRNPILKTLCERIAKQERRHFAWYFNHARERLEASRSSRILAKTLLRINWVPVGAGVKSEEEVFRLFGIIFPDEIGRDVSEEIDLKMGTLPGLSGIRLMRRYFATDFALNCEERDSELLIERPL